MWTIISCYDLWDAMGTEERLQMINCTDVVFFKGAISKNLEQRLCSLYHHGGKGQRLSSAMVVLEVSLVSLVQHGFFSV